MQLDKTNALLDNSEGKNIKLNNIIPDSESNNNLETNRFIKLFINFLNWEWYLDNNTKILFIHCLLKANWKPTKWKGEVLEAGQFVTSLIHLAEETGLSLKQVRLALTKLKRANEVAQKGASRYSIITVKNWDKWQGKGQGKGQTEGKQRATDIEYIEYNNSSNNNICEKNKNFIAPTIEEIEKYCLERKNNVNAKKFYDYYSANNWKDGTGKPVLNWKQKLISTWEKNNNSSSKGGDEVETTSTWNPNL